MTDSGPHPSEPAAASKGTQPDVASAETVAPESASSVFSPRDLSGLELPRPFGRYQLLRMLGTGGMGSVYLAHDTQLDRPVALKVPHITSSEGPEVLARFYREARAAATLHHPNICPLHDVGEIDGIPYLTMTFIEGESLAQRTRPGKRVSQRWAADMVRRIALAMAEAHSKGVIHRDLKPANVLIDQRGEPVIMDFGVARRQSESTKITRSGGLVGTPEYMSPEQALGREEEIGPGCDIYALGVILYHLLTGRVPFRGSLGVILTSIVTQPLPPPTVHRPDIDPRLDAICQRALAKKIADRFASMLDFADALENALAAGDIPDDPPTPTPDTASQLGNRSRVAVPPIRSSSATSAPTVPPERVEFAPTVSLPAPPRRSRVGMAVGLLLLVGASGGGLVYWLSLSPPPVPPSQPVAVAPTRPELKPATLPSPSAQQHYEAALAALKEQQTETAIQELTTALKLDPNFASASSERARAYASQGEHDAAVKDYTAALKSPAHQTADVYRRRAASFEALKRDSEAAADYVIIRKLDPKDSAALLGAARAHFRLGKLDPSLEECNAALDLDARLPAALVLRGRIAAKQNHEDQAVRDFTDAIKIDPALAEAYLRRGDVFLSGARFEAAAEDYGKALELAPKDADAQAGVREVYHHLGHSYFSAKDKDREKELERAIAYFSERLRRLENAEPMRGSELGRAYAQRGRAYQLRNKSGDLASAVKDYTAALARNSDDLFSLVNRGDAHAQLGEWAKADADLTRALILNVPDFRLFYLLAHLRLQQGDLADYQKFCKEAWTTFAASKEMSEANLLVWLVSFAHDSGVDHKAVIELAEKVLASKKPRSPAYLNTLGAAEYRAGSYADAVKHLTEAVEVRNQTGVMDDWLLLAMAEQQQGHAEAAGKWFAKAAIAVDQALKEKPKDGSGMTWTRRLELQLLRKEAEGVVKGGKS